MWWFKHVQTLCFAPKSHCKDCLLCSKEVDGRERYKSVCCLWVEMVWAHSHFHFTANSYSSHNRAKDNTNIFALCPLCQLRADTVWSGCRPLLCHCLRLCYLSSAGNNNRLLGIRNINQHCCSDTINHKGLTCFMGWHSQEKPSLIH